MRKLISKMVRDGNAIPTDIHPEDQRMHREGVADAKRFGPAWCEARKAEIFAAILTYADDSAEEIFATLREQFWTTDWSKKRKRGGK